MYALLERKYLVGLVVSIYFRHKITTNGRKINGKKKDREKKERNANKIKENKKKSNSYYCVYKCAVRIPYMP